ncbi:MAG: hypothetical protein ABSB74_16925 [Tepidisphaeraceae bacterium]
MLRYPVIFLIGIFLTLGPAPFERLHLAEANRSWARVKPVTAGGSHPAKRLPVRPPVHDPSTCAICVMLHAPLTAQHSPPMPLGPTARLGYSPVESPLQYSPICTAAEQCRGPPSA